MKAHTQLISLTIISVSYLAIGSPVGQFETVELPYHPMKRSMALGRLEFRPGKRSANAFDDQGGTIANFNDDVPSFESFQNWLRPTRRIQSTVIGEPITMEELESYPSSFSLLSEAQMGKRSMAVGRSGFRPGKRSIATGREGFRPGKRAVAIFPYIFSNMV